MSEPATGRRVRRVRPSASFRPADQGRPGSHLQTVKQFTGVASDTGMSGSQGSGEGGGGVTCAGHGPGPDMNTSYIILCSQAPSSGNVNRHRRTQEHAELKDSTLRGLISILMVPIYRCSGGSCY